MAAETSSDRLMDLICRMCGDDLSSDEFAQLQHVLRSDPAQVEQAFGRLLLANPPARVLRFLDEDTSLRSELRLIRTLPPVPHLRAAARLAVRAGHSIVDADNYRRRASP